MAIPYDADSEYSVIGRMMLEREQREEALSRLVADVHFHTGECRWAFQFISECYQRDEVPDMDLLCDRLVTKHRVPRDTVDRFRREIMTVPAFIEGPIRNLEDLGVRRQMIAFAERAAVVARRDDLPIDALLSEVYVDLDAVHVPMGHVPTPTLVQDAILEPVGHDWLIRHLLERRDRLILTGMEGYGKSLALRAWGLMAANGLHPFTFERIRPLRVLLIDCENSEDQLRRSWRDLCLRLSRHFGVLHPSAAMAYYSIPQGIDVVDPRDAKRLDHMVSDYRADLVIAGPLYKMFRPKKGQSKHDESLADEVCDTLYRNVCDRHGAAIWLEAHAPHGERGDRAGMRPIGASAWLRWPEFGFGLVSDGERVAGGRRYELKPFRGGRDRWRDWPSHVYEGQQWPWMAQWNGADHPVAHDDAPDDVIQPALDTPQPVIDPNSEEPF